MKKDIICPFCHCPIEDVHDDMVICNKCGTPHHKDCWEEGGHCAVYGCYSMECHGLFDPMPQRPVGESVSLEDSSVTDNVYPVPEVIHNVRIENRVVAIVCGTVFLIILLIFSFMIIRERIRATRSAAAYAPSTIPGNYREQDRECKITVLESMTELYVGQGPQEFKWDVRNYPGNFEYQVKNLTPNLIELTTDEYARLYVKPIREGMASFVIKVTGDINIANNPRTIKILIINPNKPKIVLKEPFDSLKVGEKKQLKVGLSKNYRFARVYVNALTDNITIIQNRDEIFVRGDAVGDAKIEIEIETLFRGENVILKRTVDFSVKE